MTDEPVIYNSVAPLRNVQAMSQLLDRVQKRDRDLPGMACFYGPSGFGKTTAAAWNANRMRAYWVQVKSAWTTKKLCTSILEDVGIVPRRTIADQVDQISDELAKSGRPLLIDEADYLVSRSMIEIVRDIYESSKATIVLIGEEALPQKLQRWERVHGRMLEWVAAQPADLPEVGILAGIRCKGIALEEDLQQLILTASNASVRRICVNLDRVRERARTRGLRRMSAADWGKADFYTGAAPAPRRISA